MNTRICNKCKLDKPLEAFSKEKARALGHAYTCKECKKARFKAWTNTPEGKEYRMKYKSTARENERKSIDKYKYKRNAREALKAAVKKGIVKRLSCEVCGELKTQAHHEDYSKPLEVKWLCSKHHNKIHFG